MHLIYLTRHLFIFCFSKVDDESSTNANDSASASVGQMCDTTNATATPARLVSLRDHLADERHRRMKRTQQHGVAFWSVGPNASPSKVARGIPPAGAGLSSRSSTAGGAGTGPGGRSASDLALLRTRILAQQAAEDAERLRNGDAGYDPVADVTSSPDNGDDCQGAGGGQSDRLFELARASTGARGAAADAAAAVAAAQVRAILAPRYNPATGTTGGAANPQCLPQTGVAAMTRARVGTVGAVVRRARSAAVLEQERAIEERRRERERLDLEREKTAMSVACGLQGEHVQHQQDGDCEQGYAGGPAAGAAAVCHLNSAGGGCNADDDDMNMNLDNGDSDDDGDAGAGQIDAVTQRPNNYSSHFQHDSHQGQLQPQLGPGLGHQSQVQDAVAVAQMNTYLRLWNMK